MLRISRDQTPGPRVVLRLEGRVVGPWVEELLRTCEPLMGGDRGVSLDLAEVSYVDAEGARALRALQDRGARLERESPFVYQQLRTMSGT